VINKKYEGDANYDTTQLPLFYFKLMLFVIFLPSSHL